LCALIHKIHTGRAPQYLVDSVQSVAESSRRPGLELGRGTRQTDKQTDRQTDTVHHFIMPLPMKVGA